jgi:hypothetical protein
MSFFNSIFSRIKKAHLVFGLLFVIYLTFFLWQRWNDSDESGWKKIIVSDGKGYYSYLTHLFIENDLTYRADEHLYAVPTDEGKYINRFYCGTAILEAPFFFLGYGVATIFNYPLDGYSEPFAFCLVLSAIFYTLAGFYFIYILLKRKFGLDDNTALTVVFIGALGTNIIFYATILAVFSHAYSFFTIAWLMYQFYKTIEKPSTKNVFISALLLSLIVVIRPVNAIVILLLPFFFENGKSFLDFTKKILLNKNVLYLLIGGLIPVFIQCWFWYMQTGNWMEWSYKQEGFNFTHPEIFRVLFSFRRGLFIYCPLLLISLFGFYFWWKESRWKTIWLFTFLFFFTYIISSWWHWTYGDTFGMRPFNDVIIIFMLLFGILIWKLQGWMKRIILVFSCFAVFLNLVYAYQYTNEIIRYSNMDRKKFFMVFLKTSDKYKRYFGGINDIPPYAPNGFESIHYFENKFDDKENNVFHIKGEEFPGGTEFIYPADKHFVRHMWIEVSLKRKLLTADGAKDLLFVMHSIDPNNDTIKLYSTERVKEYPIETIGEWEEIHLRIWLPNSFDGKDKVSLYLWNKGKEEFYLDDFKINVQLPIWVK